MLLKKQTNRKVKSVSVIFLLPEDISHIICLDKQLVSLINNSAGGDSRAVCIKLWHTLSDALASQEKLRAGEMALLNPWTVPSIFKFLQLESDCFTRETKTRISFVVFFGWLVVFFNVAFLMWNTRNIIFTPTTHKKGLKTRKIS